MNQTEKDLVDIIFNLCGRDLDQYRYLRYLRNVRDDLSPSNERELMSLLWVIESLIENELFEKRLGKRLPMNY